MATDRLPEPLLGRDGEVSTAAPWDNLTSSSPSVAFLAVARKALGCSSVSVTTRSADGSVEGLATSDAVVLDADLFADRAGGSTLVGLEMEGQLLVHDAGNEIRWPLWPQAMAEQGVRSVLVTSFRVSKTVVGAVSAYWTESVFLDAEVQEAARRVAQLAADNVARDRELGPLRAAMTSRLAIGQAQGLPIARFGVDADQAIAILSRYSQECNIKLRDIAPGLVESGQLPLRSVVCRR